MMLKKKPIAAVMAILLATVSVIPPALAQSNDSYQQQLQDYQRQRDQYERDRAQYDRTYGQPAPAAADNYGRNDANADREYTAADDPYYRDCQQRKTGNAVGGFFIGALAGGVLGSTIARGPARGGGTALGAVLGGALGASVGNNSVSCEDRENVYHTYYSGFESGRTGTPYTWRTRDGRRGEFVVNRYYSDRRGERCADYDQTIWINGRPEHAVGEACRQRDGNWVMVN